MVGEVDRRVGLDNFEPHDSLFHQRSEKRAFGLQLLRTAAQTVGDARYHYHDKGQHEDDKECEFRANVEQHGHVEHHAHNGNHQLLDGIERALLILHHVGAKPR